ncbi:MAG: rhomboid family intramembrane serine protease, partial [Gammaproteobacteria bacterium]|nr:rhomboid family intramembrane serine protease [Gammaproteobacteria bacterium]
MFPLHDDNPTTLRPILTVSLIGLCALVFIWQQSLGGSGNQQVIFSLGLIPATLLRDASLAPELYWVPAPVTVLTSMFLHGGWMHL